MRSWRLPREELAGKTQESFRPPPLRRTHGFLARCIAPARRFFDLQFGSAWRDLALLMPTLAGTVADVGCGAQPFRELLPPGVRYIGVDIAGSQDQFGYRAVDTRYYDGDILPLNDAEADAVLCTETLEHVLRPAQFLRELNRGLASDGRLLITVPFAARWHFIPHDFWRYTPSGLKHLLDEAGFYDIKIYARGGAAAVAAYKMLGFVLLLLSGGGGRSGASIGARLAGLVISPIGVMAAVIGNFSLRYACAVDDTLGYTVLARKIPVSITTDTGN